MECGQRDPVSIRRHFLRNHAKMRALYFCPLDGCPSIMPDEEGLREHLLMVTHKGANALPGEIDNFMEHSSFWPLPKAIADAIMTCKQRLHGYGMLHSMAGVAMSRTFVCSPEAVMTLTVKQCVEYISPRFQDAKYQLIIDQRSLPVHNPVGHPTVIMGVPCFPVPVRAAVRPIPPPTPSVFVEQTRARGRRPRRLENMGRGGITPVGGLALPRPAREPVKERPLIDLLDTDIPVTVQNEACLQPVVPEDTRERNRVFLEMSDTPSLEGAKCTCVGSVAVFPLQRRDSATVLPCPEEKDNFIVKSFKADWTNPM